MVSTSPAQARLMAAVAHGWHKPGGGGPPVSVAKEFNKADIGKSFFQGGSAMSKSSGLHNAAYAQGGSVLPRSRDFKKEPNEDFLKTPDRFRNDGGKDRDPTPEPTEDVWGKGSSKANPTPAKKTEKPVKPRQ